MMSGAATIARPRWSAVIARRFSASDCCWFRNSASCRVGIYGSELANDLAKIDQNYNRDCLIVADLSNDATYGEALFDTFGRRVIGVQIGRSGDGTTCQRRPVRNGVIPVYNVGRPFCSNFCSRSSVTATSVCPIAPESRRTYEQLMALEPEQRDNGIRL